MYFFFNRGFFSLCCDKCHPKFWVRLWECSNGGDRRSSWPLLHLMGVVSMHILCLSVHAHVRLSFIPFYIFPVSCFWLDVHVRVKTGRFCSRALLFINIASATQEQSTPLYIQAAGQKSGQVVSKKWCDSCVQLRLDPFLDKITQGAATWCPLHRSVSPITPSVSYSVSFFIWTAPFFLRPSSSLSQTCLSPLFF